MTKLTCRECKWETEKKHFHLGFISEENNNHLCMVCYNTMWGNLYSSITKDEVVKYYENKD